VGLLEFEIGVLDANLIVVGELGSLVFDRLQVDFGGFGISVGHRSSLPRPAGL
jgi:hypothetical protein